MPVGDTSGGKNVEKSTNGLIRSESRHLASPQSGSTSGMASVSTAMLRSDASLVWTLARRLGEGFTLEVRSAWANVYGVLAGTMQAGAAEVGECAPPSLSAGSLHETVAAHPSGRRIVNVATASTAGDASPRSTPQAPVA